MRTSAVAVATRLIAVACLVCGLAFQRAVGAQASAVTVRGGPFDAPLASFGTVWFTVTNNTSQTQNVQWDWSCGDFTALWDPSVEDPRECGIDTHGGALAPGEVRNVSITVWTGNEPHQGNVRLRAWIYSPYSTSTAWSLLISPRLPSDQPTVGPKGRVVQAIPRVARTDTFSVTNSGAIAGTYHISAICGAFGAAGCSVSPTTLALAAGASANATVTYAPAATNGGTSLVTLVAAASIRADTGSIVVTALDAVAPLIAATPGQATTLTTRAFTATVNVCDDGVVSNPQVTFNGVLLPDMFLRAPQGGCLTAGTSTFALLAQPGDNYLVVTASDGYNTGTLTRVFSYDNAPESVPQVAVLVPAQMTPPNVPWTDTFTVRNPGPLPAPYMFSAICYALPVCSVQPSAATVGAGETIKVVVGFASPEQGPLYIVGLMASLTSPTGNTVTRSAARSGWALAGGMPQITVSVADGATYTSPGFGATITWCSTDNVITTREIWLGGVAVSGTYVPTYQPGCLTAGTTTLTNLTLVPWDQALVARATDGRFHMSRVSRTINYTPSLDAFGPSVTPKNIHQTITRGAVNARTFVVTNTGAYSATYRLTPSCGAFTVCSADKSSITLAPGARDSARVSFLAPTAIGAFSPIKLVARYTAPSGATIADSGQVMAATPSAYELFQPKVVARYPLLLVQPGGISSLPFTIQNLGTESATYSVTVGTPEDYWFVAPHLPIQTISLNPGESQLMDLQPATALVPNRTDAVSVRVSYTASDGTTVTAIDSTLVTTTAITAGVQVTPHLATKSLFRDPNTALPYAQDFQVRNTGNSPASYAVTVVCTGVIANCSAPPSLNVATGALGGVSVSYRLAGLDTGSLILTASNSSTSQTVSDAGRVVFSIAGGVTKALAVLPESIAVPVPLGMVAAESFRIENRGGADAVYRYSWSCTGIGQAFQRCDSGSGVTDVVAAGQFAAIEVPFTASAVAGLTGMIRFMAADTASSSVTQTGVVVITTAAMLPVNVSVRTAGASETIARDQCLTIAAGDDAAYECGDLRLVHSLPATTTMNTTRTPTLIYNNRHHSGWILFPADVAIAPGAAGGKIIAKVTIENTAADSIVFDWNAQWNTSSARRIAVPVNVRSKGLPTGAYHYTFEVRTAFGSTVLAHQDTGTVAVVNRATSQFGPGWWLDGFEQFVPIDSMHKLWIGGDGTTRLYTRESWSVWLVKPTLDRADSLTTDGYGSWVRRLRNGGLVQFTPSGQQVATLSPYGQITRFYYSPGNAALLDSITLPVPIGAPARTYVFRHDPASGRVTAIDAPAGQSNARRTRINYVVVNGSSVVDNFVDPDQTVVRFAYDAAGRVTRRTNRRGYATTFEYDEAQGLRKTTVIASADNIVRSFCPAETTSLTSCATGAVDTGTVKTWIDGPRQDVPDRTWFRVTRYGAPAAIIDAQHNTTQLERGDPKWPLLVTKVVDPRGHTIRASYSPDRGLLATTTDLNPNSLSADIASGAATTIYTWHPVWDRVTQVISPVSTITTFYYNASGDRVVQLVGNNPARAVMFGYDPPTRLVTSVTTPQSPLPTRFDYDALGNLLRTTTPRGNVSTRLRDYVGRDSVVTTPINDLSTAVVRTQVYTYDLMDRALVVTDAGQTSAANTALQTLRLTNQYDDEGNLVVVTRSNVPSLDGPTDVVIAAEYDEANRKVREHDPSQLGDPTLAQWHYDPAGNITAMTRGTKMVTADYDTLNRVVHRVVTGIGTNRYTPQASSDDQRFEYDAAGNMKLAWNNYARVGRAYTLGGNIAFDTLRIASTDVGAADFTRHKYIVGYQYDVAGRRTAMTLPSNLGLLATVGYGYHAETGDLASITDGIGGTFRYVYTMAGLLDSLVQRDGTAEKHYYDADGREIRRTEWSPSVGALHDDVFQRDGRGNALSVTSQTLGAGINLSFAYNGLGAVLESGGSQVDRFTRDALGNALTHSVAGTDRDGTYRTGFEPNSTRLTWTRALLTGQVTDSLHHYYDIAGDVVGTEQRILVPHQCEPGTVCNGLKELMAWSSLANDYDADGRLLLSRKTTSNDNSGLWQTQPSTRFPSTLQRYEAFERGVTEEYRYDALGRRVWTRAHREPFCPTQRDRDSTTNCLSSIERTVYDGNQVLYEIRQIAADGVSSSTLESDAGGAGSEHFGVIAYLNGAAIDRPLELVRSVASSVITVLPHYQWQGAADVVTATNGQFIQCGKPNVAAGGCKTIDLPGASMTFGFQIPHRIAGPPSWWGTTIGMKQNASGMIDMRNRQYDPRTGRFTQEDPAGLAGGMNLYGFAGGDPVNHSDPFGLMACPPACGDASSFGLFSGVWDLAVQRAKTIGGAVIDLTPIGDVNRSADAFKGGDYLAGAGYGMMATIGVFPAGESAVLGFRSFTAFKRVAGAAGAAMHWHHVVAQTASNIERFGAEAIHTRSNIMAVNAATHAKISGFYSSKAPVAGGQTVRDWIGGQSFEAQREFGLQVLRTFGVIR